MGVRLLLSILTISIAMTTPGAAQVLTLGDALHRADQGAYSIRISGGGVEAERGQAVASLRGFLPTLRVEGGYVRTTDPLGAFGFSLRQRTVSPASFDPAALNSPAPIGNLTSGLVLEQPIFNADAWLGRRAALRARDAATAAETWTRASAAFDVVRAYYDAVLASEQLTTREAALVAARAHLRQAESLLRNGLATRSDALIASVRVGEAEVAVITARGDQDLARHRLALTMGSPADTLWSLPSILPDADRVRTTMQQAEVDSAGSPRRADVEAAGFARAAAAADLARAKSLYLPRINSFGRLDWNTASNPFGGQESWTVGVMMSWSPFSGASERGDIQAARGRNRSAEAAAEVAAARANLEVRQADNALLVAQTRLDIAERAVVQSAEAHRIVSRKYDGGLATVVELFDAAAIETESLLSFADARHQAITAAAERRLARGLDLFTLTTLDP